MIKEHNFAPKPGKYLYILAFLYLLIPYILFLSFFLKKTIGIPLALMAVVSLLLTLKNAEEAKIKIVLSKKEIIILCLILIWVIFSGVGGFTWQNYWDHKFRNAIFMDLVRCPWPVENGNYILSYYLGFWLPSALVGKIFGLTAGYAFQVLWAYAGVCIAYFLICDYMGNIRFRYLIILILFSGLDVIGFVGTQLAEGEGLRYIAMQLAAGQHIELAMNYFNSSSNTTLLFWLYNQCIPFWVGFLLLIKQRKTRSYGMICALMLLYSPFPLVGMLPMVFYRLLIQKGKLLKDIWKDCLSPENVFSLALAIPVAAYFGSNIAVSKLQILPFSKTVIVYFIAYFILEYGIYLFFILKNKYVDGTLVILGITTGIFSFFVLGNSYDFAWRTCIPFAFYIMLKINLVINKYVEEKSWKKLLLLTAILILGAVTPITEMIRSARGEWKVIQKEETARSDSLSSVFVKENNECYDNFIGSKNSLYGKYFMPVRQ